MISISAKVNLAQWFLRSALRKTAVGLHGGLVSPPLKGPMGAKRSQPLISQAVFLFRPQQRDPGTENLKLINLKEYCNIT